MRILLSLVLSASLFSVAAQDAKSDSIIFQEHLARFINREFLTLTSNTELNQLESKYRTKLNSLGSCLVVFTHANLERAELAGMKARIQEFAKLLFDEGTPIYLSIGGSKSVEWTAEQQKKNRTSNLTFVSLGNYCVVEKREGEFESIFNRKTLELLGIEKL